MSEKVFEVQKESESELRSGVLDMIIAFDTTGSMMSYINDVKLHVKKLIPELLDSNPDMRLGIVTFGDYCDMVSKDDFGNAYRYSGISRNANELIDFVQSSPMTSGGDADEFYELVLHKILNETEWRSDAKKTILLIADAHPHKVGYSYGQIVTDNQIDWRQEMHAAINMGVQIDTLSLCFYGEDWYKELSEKTNGVYSLFKTSEKTSDFIKTAAWARGGDRTAAKYKSMSFAYAGDVEMNTVLCDYAVKNYSASLDTMVKTDEDLSLHTDAGFDSSYPPSDK